MRLAVGPCGKSGWSVGERRRGLVEKEGASLGRDAWAAGGEAGEKADGSVVCAMLGAWGWDGSEVLGSRASCVRVNHRNLKAEMEDAQIGHVSYRVRLIGGPSFGHFEAIAANTKFSCTSLGSSLLEHYSYLITYSARIRFILKLGED